MKKNTKNKTVLKLIISILILTNSCKIENNDTLSEITGLYSGLFELSSISDINSVDGKSKVTRLTISNNDLIDNRWILPNAVANNCAILIDKANPEIISNNVRIEVEVQLKEEKIIDKSLIYNFEKEKLNLLKKDYFSVDSIITIFVNHVINSNYDSCLVQMDELKELTKDEFNSFMDMFHEIIPDKFIASRIIGYEIIHEDDNSENLILINAVLESSEDYQKMFNITIFNDNSKLKIREVQF